MKHHLIDKNSSQKLFILLDIVDNKSSLNKLISEGLEYSQIALLIVHAEQEEYIDDNDSLKLTKKGHIKLEELRKKYSKEKKEKEIELKSIDNNIVNDVYIPNIRKLNLF